MIDDDVDRAAFDAISMALRLIYQLYEIDAPATEFDRPWAMLREIADGRTTLSNPADMAARFPGLKELLYDSANRVVEHDREVAGRVLRGLTKSF